LYQAKRNGRNRVETSIIDIVVDPIINTRKN